MIWQGRASVTSRDYRNPTAPPRPMWMGQYWERTGTYSDEYGPVWVPGNASTSVVFDSSGASSILCPILCTTEKTVVNGDITFGARTAPMVYYFMCDNNGIYPQWVDWGSTGCFYGVMVIMESTIVISGGDGVIPNVEGAVFAGCPYVSGTTPSKSDIELEGSSMVAYNQAIIDAVAASSIETTTVVTEIVPGSWQHLSASD
ncbi:MAG: hypothetical protein FJ000_03410 [Actinobacteria bacterium]|nr:hypothetical protein [Actinomycetota bacterium]